MYFFCRLLPPRPTFAMDMTPTESEAMKKHVACWSDLLAKRKVVAFGPVGDPEGPWGLGIVDVRDEAALRQLQENDPAILARIGLRYEAYPMPRVVHGGQGAQ
jgi:YCII-related domain-containing protein